jgi:hypothetical protein
MANGRGNRRGDLIAQPTVELVRRILLTHIVGAYLVPDLVHWPLTCVILDLFLRYALVGSALEGLHLLALLFGVPRPLLGGLLTFLVTASLPLGGGCLVTLLLLLICHGLLLNHAVSRSFPGHVIQFGHFKPAASLLELLLKLRLYRIVLNEGLQQADCYLLEVYRVETDNGLVGVTTIN